MKSFIVLALCVAVAVALPLDANQDAQILRQQLNNIGVEQYQYGYETSNGISGNEQGQLVNAGTPEEGVEAQGEFSYVAPDGVTYSVRYTAGKNGFVPVGDHIPKA